ncbi:response regulator [Paenibacillus sp. MWE-103]|uniref:Response regulator n=1 Tax=Paenibacillus artemisiicola TaxID=1172618 RepID=A0ABS3WGJ2_9BACL|nr:response regulator [Paenibacillus artemisiicola]MBO7747451.1 response regulator [Paenibacillus artemisiicola]
MLKVMIADDNPVICRALASRIPWEALGLELAGVCFDGAELLPLALRETPDIILTDIRMPVTDGLSLIEQLRLKGVPVQVVIISGYDDFQYMKKAIDFDVVAYLKKPVQDGELQDALRKASGLVRERERVTRISRSVEALEERERIRALNLTLLAWLRDARDGEGGLPAAPDVFAGANAAQWLLFRLPMGEDYKFRDADLDADRLPAYRRLAVRAAGEGAIVCRPAEALLAVLAPHASRERTAETIRALQAQLDRDGLPGEHAAGRPFARPEEAGAAFLETAAGLYGRLYGAPFRYRGAGDAFSAADQHTLRMHLAMHDYVGASRLLADWLERYLAAEPSCAGLDYFVKAAIGIYAEYVPMFRALRGELETAALPALALPGKRPLLELLRKPHDWQESDGGKTAAIIAHIERRFDRPITLEDVAKRFHYNVIYLGQLIKRETGMPFNQYVSKLRIDRAVEMLGRNKDIKLADLSQQLGFSDSKYFSKVFKKFTGRSPSRF